MKLENIRNKKMSYLTYKLLFNLSEGQREVHEIRILEKFLCHVKGKLSRGKIKSRRTKSMVYRPDAR